ncbi:MAG: AsmA family protein, partial [Pseudomonadota bacterium]
MDKASNLRKSLKWTLIALVSFVVIAVLVLAGTAALVDAGHFHAQILRYVVAKSGREIRVAGPVHTRLFSLHPMFTARQVVIGNPPWMPAGNTAEIAQLSVDFDLSLLPPSWSIRSLQLDTVRLHLLRDEKGLSNWRSKPLRSGDGPPLIHSVLMRDAQVDLHDARRHLDFEGLVTAQDRPAVKGLRPLHVEGAGQLNGRAVSITLDGDPLATVSQRKPYQFRFSERSSGSRLTGSGSLLRPLDFRNLTTTFEAAGEDMQDLYFLTGLTLPDTGAYQLAGKLVRSDLRFTFTDLVATTGRSDMRGTVTVDSTRERTQIDAQLHSKLLRLKDLGKEAAERATEPKDAPLLPAAPLRLKALRRNDGVMNFQVDHFDAGRIQLKAATAAVRFDHGKLSVAPSAAFADGNLSGSIIFDASHEVPTAEMNLGFTGLRLEQLAKARAAGPPFEGLLRGRVILKGEGISAHGIAASANGKVTVVLPRGAVRASLAELAGVDLRGIGL